MNIDPEMPKIPRIQLSRKPAERSFEQVLESLRPQLEKLPPEQRLLPLPPTAEMLEEVQSYVKSLGLTVPPMPPPTVGVGGELLDPLRMKEGRVGLHRKQRVAAFLYRYADKSLRAVIVFPRAGVDIRKLALAIVWGQVADIPEAIVQTEIVTVTDFFAICAYNLAKLIDVPALERFKADYRVEVDAELSNVRQQADALAKKVNLLGSENVALTEEMEKARQDSIRQHNRAEVWKLFALIICATFPLALAIFRYLF